MAIPPPEADSPLLVDPDAVLALPVTLESLALVRGRNRQILQITRSIQLLQLHQCPLLNISWETLGILAFPHSFRLLVAKRFDHLLIVTRHVSAVKRYYEASDQPAALVDAIPGRTGTWMKAPRSNAATGSIIDRIDIYGLRRSAPPLLKAFSVGSKDNLCAKAADRFPVFCIRELIPLLVNPLRLRTSEGEKCPEGQCFPHAGCYAARSRSLRFFAE